MRLPSQFPRIIAFSLLVGLSSCASLPVEHRTDLFWPLPPDPPRIHYVRSLTEPADLGRPTGLAALWRQSRDFLFGRAEPPRLIQPHAIYSDGQGKVYITDIGLQVVHLFDLNRKTYRQVFQFPGGRLFSPVGVTANEEGTLYVADSELNRILVFDAEGTFRHLIGKTDDFVRVAGITLNPKNGLLYAVDAGGHRVQVFDRDGQHVRTIGQRGREAGTFNFPTHIAVDSSGFVYITDSLNFRIQVFDSQGKFVKKFGRAGNTIGTFSKPKGIAVTPEGHIYVVDGLYDTVQVFSNDGQLLMHFGQSGAREGNFWLPTGIFVDSQNQIFVADTHNHRVQIFQYLHEEQG